jgi:hypothetical protein
MSLKFLRVNPEHANIATGIAFVVALLFSCGSCWYFILFYLFPYLYHHVSIIWH